MFTLTRFNLAILILLFIFVALLSGCPGAGAGGGSDDSSTQDDTSADGDGTDDGDSAGDDDSTADGDTANDGNTGSAPVDGESGSVAVISDLTEPTITETGGALYFAPTSEELWKYDGSTAGKVLSTTEDAADLGAGDFEKLIPYAGDLYFLDDTNGVLYRYDGQDVVDVTTLVTEANGFVAGSEAAVYDGRLYVAANGDNGGGGDTGVELWAYDASAATITLVEDIRAASAAQNSYPADFVPTTSGLYFTAIDTDSLRKLWKYAAGDGAVVVAEEETGNIRDFQSAAPYNGTLYLAADADGVANSFQYQLYSVNESAVAAEALVEVSSVASGFDGENDVNNLLVHDGFLYFTAEEGFYRYNGTSAVELSSVLGESGDTLAPEYPVVYDGNIYFSGKVSNFNYRELWRFDGTDAAATLVWDVDGVADDGSKVSSLHVYDGKLFFFAEDVDNVTALRYYTAP